MQAGDVYELDVAVLNLVKTWIKSLRFGVRMPDLGTLSINIDGINDLLLIDFWFLAIWPWQLDFNLLLRQRLRPKNQSC